MQKSKATNLLIVSIIFVYTILSIKYMYHDIMLYTYIINPIFWILLAIIVALGIKLLYKKRLKKEIINYTIIAVLSYIIIYSLSGLFSGFGQNPYSTNITGIIMNFWLFGTVVVAKEIIRYKIINNTYDKDKMMIGVLVVIVYTIFEVGTTIFTIKSEYSTFFIFKQTTLAVLPIILKNILFTYIAANSDYKSPIIYELVMKAFLWIPPVLPNSPWILSAVINISIPTILFLYIRYIIHKKEVFKEGGKNVIYLNPKGVMPLIVLVILAILFANRFLSY